MAKQLSEVGFDKIKAGQLWVSNEIAQNVGDYTLLWIVKDTTHQHEYDEDTIIVHQYDKKEIVSDKENYLRLSMRIGYNSWLTIGYEDFDLELSNEDSKKMMIWAIFQAKETKGRVKEWKI
jgi:hypothetical protein